MDSMEMTGPGPRHGFSLLEVLITAVIIGTLVLPLMSSIHTGHQESERIAEETVAADLGSSLLEKLASISYDQLPIVAVEIPDTQLAKKFADPRYAPVIEPYPDEYTRRVTIEQVSQGGDAAGASAGSEWGNLKLLTVRVVWRPEYLRQKSERVLTFTTLVTDDRG